MTRPLFIVHEDALLLRDCEALLKGHNITACQTYCAATDFLMSSKTLTAGVVVWQLLRGEHYDCQIRQATANGLHRCVVLAEQLELADAAALIAAGAVDVLVRGITADRIVQSVLQHLERGRRLVLPKVTAQAARDLIATLAPSEVRVFKLLCSGHSHSEIGAQLGMTSSLVAIIRTDIFHKLACTDLSSAIKLSILAHQGSWEVTSCGNSVGSITQF